MKVHLIGRPCRTEDYGGMVATTPHWRKVSCSECRQTNKYQRLYAKEPRP